MAVGPPTWLLLLVAAGIGVGVLGLLVLVVLLANSRSDSNADRADNVPKKSPPLQSIGDIPPDIAQALRAGQKIQAVKLYREATGLGLAESKAAVDEMERRLGRG